MRRKTFTRQTASWRSKVRRLGAAAVEFAIVAPLFFLFVFGIIEFGRVMLVKNVITNASREAARVAVIDGATSTEVEQVARKYSEAGTVADVTVTISPSNLSTATQGTPITVTVSVNFNDVSWLPTPAILKDLSVSGKTTMRRESF